MEQACRDTGHRVLASAALLDRLSALPPGVAKRSIGRLRLRGKASEIELYALAAAAATTRAAARSRPPLDQAKANSPLRRERLVEVRSRSKLRVWGLRGRRRGSSNRRCLPRNQDRSGSWEDRRGYRSARSHSRVKRITGQRRSAGTIAPARMCVLKHLLASSAFLFGRRDLVMVIVMMHHVMTMVHHRRFSGLSSGLSESRYGSNRRCKNDCGRQSRLSAWHRMPARSVIRLRLGLSEGTPLRFSHLAIKCALPWPTRIGLFTECAALRWPYACTQQIRMRDMPSARVSPIRFCSVKGMGLVP
jgi:hypothetical protein